MVRKTFASLLITIIPVICYAVVTESLQITVDSVPTVESAHWVQIFSGKPGAQASLSTDGLLFRAEVWGRLFGRQPNIEYDLDGTGFSAIDSVDGSLLSEISKIREAGLTGSKLRFENTRLSLWFPDNDRFINVFAVCTESDILPPGVSAPAISSLPISSEGDSKLFAYIEEGLSTNMWPKSKRKACEKGQGIAVKFGAPNSNSSDDILYYGTLTVTKEEKKPLAEEIKVSTDVIIPMPENVTTAPLPGQQISWGIGGYLKKVVSFLPGSSS